MRYERLETGFGLYKRTRKMPQKHMSGLSVSVNSSEILPKLTFNASGNNG